MGCVTCVCVWLGAGWEVLGGELVRGLGLGLTNPGGTWGSRIYVCVLVAVMLVWVVLGECVFGLGHGPGRWGGVMFVCVVSLDYLC